MKTIRCGSSVYYTGDGKTKDNDFFIIDESLAVDFRHAYENGNDNFYYSSDDVRRLCELSGNDANQLAVFNLGFGDDDDKALLDLFNNREKYIAMLERMAPMTFLSEKLGPGIRCKWLIYAYIPLCWLKNGSYTLTEEQQSTVNRLYERKMTADEIGRLWESGKKGE